MYSKNRFRPGTLTCRRGTKRKLHRALSLYFDNTSAKILVEDTKRLRRAQRLSRAISRKRLNLSVLEDRALSRWTQWSYRYWTLSRFTTYPVAEEKTEIRLISTKPTHVYFRMLRAFTLFVYPHNIFLIFINNFYYLCGCLRRPIRTPIRSPLSTFRQTSSDFEVSTAFQLRSGTDTA